jgi:hypothetical protein
MLGEPENTVEEKTNTSLRKVGCGGMDWIELIQDRMWGYGLDRAGLG